MSKELRYKSTRDSSLSVRASEAILKGLSNEGGLFVPERVPSLPMPAAAFASLSYRECAYEIMRLFFDDFSEEELKHCIESAYDDKFDTAEIAPVREASGAWYLELFHGATIAFKDMALSILPHLMTTAARKHGVEDTIVILTATSGDTGKAALAGFADVEGTKIIVFYPKDGVSPVQKLQMVTQRGDNTFVIGVDGNFDDCQGAVKKMFNDGELKKRLSDGHFRFSSANSINIGRLVPQIVYYVYAYSRLIKNGVIKEGEEINFTVPTGNFGNILAGYYAKRMGLPVKMLICASNENRVLFDFFRSGTYDKNRKFILTSSPSMDILVSSNLERLIYHICDDNAEKTAELMKLLSTEGKYDISEGMREKLKDFAGYATSQRETGEMIDTLFKESGYIIDPHTAVAAHAYRQYRADSKDETPTVIVSTASPYKFASSVVRALEGKTDDKEDKALIDRLEELSKTKIPPAVDGLFSLPILHRKTTSPEGMVLAVEEILGL